MTGTSSWRAVARSLKNRNFRRYLIGQGTSQGGMWVQMVAELWLILEITDSGTALGIHSVLRFAPILLFGAFAGVLGDRVNRRRLLLLTQGLHTLSASILAVVVWLTTPTLVLVYSIVLIQGLINAVDNPVRRSFIRDLTDDDEISNAVSLHNTVGTVTRAIGPAVAGLLITGLGVQWCFAINAASYVAVLISLIVIDKEKLRQISVTPKGPGQIRAGFRYAWSHMPIRATLLLTSLMAVFAWQWNVILPVYAKSEFGGGASLFGFMVSVLSAGSVVGAMLAARMARLGGRHLRIAGFALAIALGIGALAPTLPLAFAGVALLGAAGSAFNISAQTRLQLSADEDMTSRVMALFSVSFTGAKPIGGLLAGVIMDASSSRAAFAAGSVALLAATGFYALNRKRRLTRGQATMSQTSST